MKTKIKSIYPHHNISDHNTDIYISDYSEQTKNDPIKKGVVITSHRPADIKSFFVKNGKSISFSSIGFDEKSFYDETTRKTLSHCECICFSAVEYNKGPWILLLELKYCTTHSSYQQKSLQEAKKQLTDTYNHYKKNGLISNKQQCYLVVSFPFFEPPFPNFMSTQSDVKNMKLNRVIFRGVNELKIKSDFKLEV